MPPETPDQSVDRFSGKTVTKWLEHFFPNFASKKDVAKDLLFLFCVYWYSPILRTLRTSLRTSKIGYSHFSSLGRVSERMSDSAFLRTENIYFNSSLGTKQQLLVFLKAFRIS